MILAFPLYSISQICLNIGVTSLAPVSLSDCNLFAFAFAFAFVVCGLRRINLSLVLVGGC